MTHLELRPYQAEAVERIVERGDLLLALVMGAGKTATSIAAVRQLRRLRRCDHVTVFALKSTKGQWVREIAKWDPRASVQVIDGDKRQRVAGIRRARNFTYTVMHYQCLVNDWEEIKRWLPTEAIVADEVTALKSFSSKTSRRAKVLGKQTAIRIGLSGQPVENRPEELFSIMEFLNPEVLGPFPKFDRTFIERDHWGKPKKYKNLKLISDRLGPAMYRKSRDDISEWLPELLELDVPVPLDQSAWDLHERIRKDLSLAIDAAIAAGVGSGFNLAAHYGRTQQMDSKGLMGQVMTRMLAMRMVSSHPSLLLLSAEHFDSPISKEGSQYASELKAAGLLDHLPKENAKFDALIEHVEEILAEDPRNKVVVFSTFKPTVALFGAALAARGIHWVKITGDVTTAKRDAAIVRFNTDPALRVFLSSDAGAYGVDLNQGSHVINFDLPWSAGALAQRVARIDRTNSAFDQITVEYMFGEDTIEDRMLRMLRQKQAVSRAFVDGDFDAQSDSLRLDLESLREFVDG
jgi:SNF2 family DNA or RNA helicase